VSPDVVWVAREQADAFVAALREVYDGLFPTTRDNPDVVPVVNERHFARVQGYVADARARGARVETAGGADAGDAANRRLPLSIVLEPAADSDIARHEIFGPAVMLRLYDDVGQAIDAINADGRPLALYYFGQDAAEQQLVLDQTLSGGVAVNDVLMHAALHDAPFGGVGASGMGHYHGHEGFLEFSHTRSVYQAGAHDPRREWGMLPPYGPHLLPMMRAAVTS